jgi:hypothetical protein
MITKNVLRDFAGILILSILAAAFWAGVVLYIFSKWYWWCLTPLSISVGMLLVPFFKRCWPFRHFIIIKKGGTK